MRCGPLLTLSGVLLCVFSTAAAAADLAGRPNVLLICVDDLRCSLGCYGDGAARSPEIDRLARESRVFLRHYAFSAACGPSRSTLLSGRRTLSWDYCAPLRARMLREKVAEPETPLSLPHLFRQNGYRTVCIGKVSHQPGGVLDPAQRFKELPFSWEAAYAPTGQWHTPLRAFFAFADGQSYNAAIRPLSREPPRLPYEAADVDDEGYPDGLNAKAAVEELRRLSASRRPFFLAVGFYKPHLPFSVPKRYWDLYDPEQLPAPPCRKPPQNCRVELSLHNSYEPTTHYQWPGGKGRVDEAEGKVLRHGYYAAVSYVDAQIGKVLAEYRRLGLEQNTIVMLWSDHGWHLGDHGVWGKWTNFECALRSPLIIRVPQQPQPGRATEAIVETVDLYPTLAALCGLRPPDNLHGRSIAELIERPTAPGKAAAIGMLQKHSPQLGLTLRTERYRYVKWIHIRTGREEFVELYDHHTDSFESNNVSADHPDVLAELDAQLQQAVAEPVRHAHPPMRQRSIGPVLPTDSSR